MPMLGHSTDRRAISHTREVLREDNIQVLMCFVCACKEISYRGFDKFGKPVNKGNICFRRPSSNEDSESEKEYRNRIRKILGIDTLGDGEAEEAWAANLSAKKFKNEFGQAVVGDPGMQEGCTTFWEWHRNVRSVSRSVQQIICCPEDVERDEHKCKHDHTFVCEDCAIPICDECFRLAAAKKKYRERWRTTISSGTRKKK